jgi:hypothetical protein
MQDCQNGALRAIGVETRFGLLSSIEDMRIRLGGPSPTSRLTNHGCPIPEHKVTDDDHIYPY